MPDCKICSKCNITFPPTREYFYADPRHDDGLQSACKFCDRERVKEYHQRDKKQKVRHRRQYNGQYRDNWADIYIARPVADPAQQIINRACAQYGVTRDELKSKSRAQRIVWARQEVMRRLYEETTLTLADIGRLLNRHHATVYHALVRVGE